MSFSQELKDFTAAFQTGYSMVDSPSDKEAKKAELRLKNAQATEAEAETTPEALDLTRRGKEADLGYKQALTTNAEAAARDANDPTLRGLAVDEKRSVLASRQASTANTAESTRTQKMANNKEATIQDAIRSRLQAAGVPVGPAIAPAASPQAAVPVDGAAPTAAPGPVSDASQPRGYRNNNPLNIETGNFAQGQPNFTGSDGRFAQFASMDDGVAAADALLGTYGRKGISSVSGVIDRWAPSSDGNNVGTYAASVAKSMGVNPDDTIDLSDPAVRKSMIGAMAQVENGKPMPDTAYTGAGPAAGAGQTAIAGVDGSGQGAGQKDMLHSAHDAVLTGLSFLAQQSGLDQSSGVQTPDQAKGQQNFLTGAGGADHAQVEEAQNVVKSMAPDHSMSPAETTMYTLATTWDVYNAAGQPDKAKAAAASLLGYYQKMYAQWGAVAQAAASDGHIDDAVKAAVKAYAFVPDGNEIAVNKKDGKYEVTMTDIQSGKVTSKTLHSPEEMGAMALQINPGNFVDFITNAAGVRNEKMMSSAAREAMPGPDGAVPPHPNYAGMSANEARLAKSFQPKAGAGVGANVKFGDRKTINESITGAFESFAENNPDKAAAIKPFTDDLQPTAEIIYAQNSIPPELAVQAATRLIDKSPDSVKANDDGKTVTVKMKGVPDLTMPIETYATLATIRKQKEQADTPAAVDSTPSPGLQKMRDGWQRILSGTPAAAPPQSGSAQRFPSTPPPPPQAVPLGPPIPQMPGSNPPQSGARHRF